jgi:Arc/MetJ family transcription regulator
MRNRGTDWLGGMLGFLAAAPTAPVLKSVYTVLTSVYTRDMTKRLVDIDEEALDAARAQLGTTTIKATVNEALRLVGSDRSEVVRNSMDVLSAMPLSDRDEAWH